MLVIQSQYFFQVPCYRFSLAVRVACQPYHISFAGCFAQGLYQLCLVFLNGIVRRVMIVKINTNTILSDAFDVTYMTLRRHHTKTLV